MCKVAKNYGIKFLWVTDGPAWRRMKEPLIRAIEQLDWVLNFKMLNFVKVLLLRR